MPKQGYEIELVRCGQQLPKNGLRTKPNVVLANYPNDFELSELATLTGKTKAEIFQELPEELRFRTRWGSRHYVAAAQALGFNVTPKFVKFDPETPWPCILRMRKTKTALARLTVTRRQETGNPKAEYPDYWYAYVYNQGDVFLVEADDKHVAQCTLDTFLHWNPDLRVTSMLSIWLDDKLHFTAKDFQ